MLFRSGAALFKYRPLKLDAKGMAKYILDLKRRLQQTDLKARRDTLKARREVCASAEEANQLLLEIHQLNKELNSLKTLTGA